MPTYKIQTQGYTSYDKQNHFTSVSYHNPSPKEQDTKTYTKSSRVEKDPVNQKERSGTRKLELVSLLAKIGSILRGWLHFGPNLGI